MHLLDNCSRNGDDGRSSCYHTVKSLITLNFVYRNSDGGGGGERGGGSREFLISSCSLKVAILYVMPQLKLSGVNLFDLKFNTCVPFSNRLS